MFSGCTKVKGEIREVGEVLKLCMKSHSKQHITFLNISQKIGFDVIGRTSLGSG